MLGQGQPRVSQERNNCSAWGGWNWDYGGKYFLSLERQVSVDNELIQMPKQNINISICIGATCWSRASLEYWCYGVNVCVPLKFTCWNSNPQKWWYQEMGPLEVLGSWEWSLQEWLVPYQRGPRETPNPFYPMRTRRKWTSQRVLTRTWPC